VFAVLPGGVGSAEVDVATGAPVDLTFDAGAYIRLRLASALDGWDATSVRIAPDPYPDVYDVGDILGIEIADSIVLPALDPEVSSTIFVGPTEDGLCALLQNVAADRSERVVTLTQGARVACTVRPPDGDRSGSLYVFLTRDGRRLARAEREDNTTYVLAGVPHGRWGLAVVTSRGTVLTRRDIVVPLGADETVELTW
jgi:hypothetical protein